MKRAAGCVLFLLAGLCGLAASGGRIAIVWPTPNTAYLEGKPHEAFIQATASGETTSGLYGSVRSQGLQFHEGIDLFPINRDRHGEATDPIFAVMDGVVRHASARAGDSSYGRYVVLEHPGVEPGIYTLYAHLRSIDDAVAPGAAVRRGQIIGVMGRSAGGYVIPKDRAHLHFEMGLRLSDRFQPWYDAKKFGSPNRHGLWNGMNLLGFDPLDFYDRFRAREVNDVRGYLARLPPAVTARINRAATPDFAVRYPSLVKAGEGTVLPAGWEVDFSVAGLPIALRRVGSDALQGYRRDEVRIIAHDAEALRGNRGRRLVRTERGRAVVDRDLQTVIELVFGL